MKPLRVIVAIVVAGVLVLLGVAQASRRGRAEAFRIGREGLRREAADRAVVARGLAGAPGSEEAAAVVRWWTERMAALRAGYPAAARAADEQREAALARAERGDEGGAASAQAKELAAWRSYAAERLAALRSGYAPVLSAVDQGLRLDVLAIQPGEHPVTHERALRIDFALWGAPRRLDPDPGVQGPHPPIHVSVPLAFRQLAFRFLDAGGKVYGEMSGNGEPYRLIKDPERFSDELPPGVALGTWWVEPFPRETVRVEVTVGATVQGMTAAALAPTFHWDVPAAEDWKLRAGEAFRAETREAAPEEPAAAAPRAR